MFPAAETLVYSPTPELKAEKAAKSAPTVGQPTMSGNLNLAFSIIGSFDTADLSRERQPKVGYSLAM
jgi:hypothetical protein